MRLEISAHHLRVGETLRALVAERVGRALARFRHRIAAVRVRFADENGERGGVDKRCRVEVHLARESVVVVEHREAHVMSALDGAVESAVRAVRRRIDKRRLPGYRTRLAGAPRLVPEYFLG